MSEPEKTQSYLGQGGQIGIAVLGIALLAASGVAWLSGGSGEDTTLAFAPLASTSSSPSPSVATTADRPATVTGPGADDDRFTVQATAPNADFTLIVRFDGESVIEDIGKSFRRDPEGARSRYHEWAADKPALRGLSLERASYSGELVLSGNGARSMSETISAIEAMDNIAYVEPDYSPKASKEG